MFLLEVILLFTSLNFTAAHPAEDLRSSGKTGTKFEQLWCNLQGVSV